MHETYDGLYRPEFEKGSCGFGLIAHMDDRPSHWLVRTAITALERLTHRGAVAADGKTGDGCGLLLKKPDAFLRAIAHEEGLILADDYASGLVFFSPEQAQREQARGAVAAALAAQGLDLAGWRLVPTDPSACGDEALKTLPHVEQVFVNAPAGMTREEFQRRLFLARRHAEKSIGAEDAYFYIPSLAVEVIAYKGLVMPANLPVFFRDLDDARMESSLAVFHQRFSTNTWPQWRLAQPFRYLAHNGEINTVQGNRNWALARANLFRTPLLPDIEALQPIVSLKGSDSESLDNMLEVLLAGGMDLFRAMRLLIPPAWQNLDTLDPDLRAFYEFNSMHMEPWDGPAGIVLTDGRYAACAMDRNGLRPARYVITRDRHITLASEVGVYDYAPEDVLIKGRLKPGQMIAADTATGQILYPSDIDNLLKSRHPYKQWLKEQVRHIESNLHYKRLTSSPMNGEELAVFQKLFGVSFEERDQVLRVLGEGGQEAVGSMGDDTPFAVLSKRHRSLYDYFRQQFAQVTNPPIDPLREQVVMSIKTCLGPERNVFEETPDHANRLMLDSPVLTEGKYQGLLDPKRSGFEAERLDLNYPLETPLQAALDDLCTRAEAAVRAGKVFLVLDDRQVLRERYPVHALLATGAVHHHLAAKGLRCSANLIVATATARDPHHFAVLLGYGATAIYPYLAYEILHQMAQSGEIPPAAHVELVQNYRKGINKGLYKIISKMGISTVASYRGAQLFEIVGLHEEIVRRCFKGTVSRIQGTRFVHLETAIGQRVWHAWNPRKLMEHGGLLKYVHGGEYHAFNPDVIGTLQKAVNSGDYAQYKAYADLVNQRPTATLRDLLAVREDIQPISVDQVEPVEAILPRFDSAGMSLGALSPEAHEALAVAMNRLGGRSNSGEGGEDPARYGTERMSKIKIGRASCRERV